MDNAGGSGGSRGRESSRSGGELVMPALCIGLANAQWHEQNCLLQVQAFLGLPAGISDNLSSASATLRSRLRNVSMEMENKIAAIQEKLANDVSVAAQKVVGGEEENHGAAKNETLRYAI